MPELPVPMTPTRMPVKSTPSWGQRLVKYVGAGEVVGALDVELLGHRQTSGGHHVVLGRQGVAGGGGDAPLSGGVVPLGRIDAGC